MSCSSIKKYDTLSMKVKNVSDFVNGIMCGLGLIFELIGFYNNNNEITLKEQKNQLFCRQNLVLLIVENIKHRRLPIVSIYIKTFKWHL